MDDEMTVTTGANAQALGASSIGAAASAEQARQFLRPSQEDVDAQQRKFARERALHFALSFNGGAPVKAETLIENAKQIEKYLSEG